MTVLCISVLNMSAAASIVAAAVLLARLLLRRAPRIFSYALWGIVFLRLVCPFAPESPASLMPVEAEVIPRSVVHDTSSFIASGIPAVDEPTNASVEDHFEPAPPYASVNPVQVYLYLGACVWLTGTAAIVLYAVIGYFNRDGLR